MPETEFWLHNHVWKSMAKSHWSAEYIKITLENTFTFQTNIKFHIFELWKRAPHSNSFPKSAPRHKMSGNPWSMTSTFGQIFTKLAPGLNIYNWRKESYSIGSTAVCTINVPYYMVIPINIWDNYAAHGGVENWKGMRTCIAGHPEKTVARSWKGSMVIFTMNIVTFWYRG